MFGFFNRFPYTDFHSLNLDWILQKVKESLANSKAALDKVDGASKAAQDAKNSANEAKISADNANVAAYEAKISANNSNDAANEAKASSENANTIANEALNVSAEAIEKSISAENTANEAVKIAQDAQAGEIAPGTITEEKLSEDLQRKINSAGIPPAGSITEAMLDSEIQAKLNTPLNSIENGAIPESKLDESLQNKINNALTEIPDNSISESKLDESLQNKINNALTEIPDNSISESKLDESLQNKMNNAGIYESVRIHWSQGDYTYGATICTLTDIPDYNPNKPLSIKLVLEVGGAYYDLDFTFKRWTWANNWQDVNIYSPLYTYNGATGFVQCRLVMDLVGRDEPQHLIIYPYLINIGATNTIIQINGTYKLEIAQ